jgi:hypothetical protein
MPQLPSKANGIAVIQEIGVLAEAQIGLMPTRPRSRMCTLPWQTRPSMFRINHHFLECMEALAGLLTHLCAAQV